MTRVLIADDNPAIRDLLGAALRRYRLDVFSAFDGHSALRKIAGVQPELLILDLEMPDMSGFDVLEKIRQESIHDNLKVIVLTANHNPGNDYRAGLADMIIAKPFNLRELVNSIEKLLSGTSMYVTV